MLRNFFSCDVSNLLYGLFFCNLLDLLPPFLESRVIRMFPQPLHADSIKDISVRPIRIRTEMALTALLEKTSRHTHTTRTQREKACAADLATQLGHMGLSPSFPPSGGTDANFIPRLNTIKRYETRKHYCSST